MKAFPVGERHVCMECEQPKTNCGMIFLAIICRDCWEKFGRMNDWDLLPQGFDEYGELIVDYSYMSRAAKGLDEDG